MPSLDIRQTCLSHRPESSVSDDIWYRFRDERLFSHLAVSPSVWPCNTSNGPQVTHLEKVGKRQGPVSPGILVSRFLHSRSLYRLYKNSTQSGCHSPSKTKDRQLRYMRVKDPNLSVFVAFGARCRGRWSTGSDHLLRPAATSS